MGCTCVHVTRKSYVMEESMEEEKEDFRELAKSVIKYLSQGVYPLDLPYQKRSNFRKRCKDFKVDAEDSQLYYIRSGNPRLALYDKDEQSCVFEVSY